MEFPFTFLLFTDESGTCLCFTVRPFFRRFPGMASLNESKLFSALQAEELDFLRAAAEERSYPAEAAIFQEGDEGDGIYVVGEGEVRISALITQNERRVLTRVGAGDFFGEMAVLDSEPRSATATAERQTLAWFIPREKLLELLERSPRLAVSLVREFSLRMRDFNRQYVQEVLQAERLTVVGRFARSIVHDFKNPLNIIGLAAELMEMEGAPASLRQSASGRIRKQVERLTNMSNELLEFTRNPGQGAVLSAVDYREYIANLVAEIGPELKEKGVELVVENEPAEGRVLMDGKRLMHVFSNLIHNAMEAMPTGGRIILRFQERDGEMVTQVEDTGSGLAPEIMPRLFEPFASYGKAKGSGLGLSICKKVVEDHQGRIRTCVEPGRGAIFEFTLSLAGA